MMANVQTARVHNKGRKVKMSWIKFTQATAFALILSLPALAADCYKDRIRGDAADTTAAAIVITLDNRGKSGFAVYIRDTDGEKYRFWLEPGEKIAPTIDLQRKSNCSKSDDYCPTVVRNNVALSYSPFSSEIDLLEFTISNRDNNGDQKTHYQPTGTPRQSVSCFLNWRPNKERWDMDIKFN